MMFNVLQNLRFGLRMLTKQPGVSAISILALALGIGLTTTMFSIVHGAMRDLPFENAHEIIHLERTNPSQGIESMAVPQHEYVDWRDQQSTLRTIAAYYQGTINVTAGERPVRFNGAFMSPESFAVLGAQPALGRPFTVADSEPGAAPVLLIGHDVWRNQFDGDRSVLGREIRVNGRPGTIIGVMPEGFAFPMDEEAWLPLQIDLTAMERGDGTWLDVFGRLAPGVSSEVALEEFNGIAARLETEYPDTNEGVRAIVKPFVQEYMDPNALAMLWTMQGAVFMVLLIACANVANLLLSRAFDRSKEVAVRSALGAGRWRVVSQFLTEVLVLTLIGGAIGLVIAKLGVGWFNQALVGIQKPYWIVIQIDWQVLAFTSAVVLAASLVAGLVPALQVSRSNLSDVLKDESRGSSGFRMGRLSRVLVVAELALSCGLLVGAGLMIKSVTQLQNYDYSFSTELFTARFGLFEADYPDVESRRQLFAEVRDQLAAEPGVLAASLTDAMPGTSGAGFPFVTIDGEAYATREDHPRANWAVATPGLFETFDAELLRGRDFSPLDTADSQQVAIVNISFAEQMFPGQNPLGLRFRIGAEDDADDWLTVVGVAADLSMNGVANFGQRGPQGFYTPMSQSDRRFVSIALSTQGPPLEIADAARRAVTAADPNLPLYWVQTLQTQINTDTWFFNVFGTLFMVFGAAALFLGTIGLYGVMSFAVRRRTAEMGIRVALGAQTRDVLGLVMRQGIWQIAIGLVLGLGLAVLASGGLQIVLFEVDPRDYTVYATIAAALGVTGLLACLLPAARASRVDPVTALRTQ